MIEILISDGRFSVDKRRLKSLVKMLLRDESAEKKTVNIVYCNDRFMGDLNSRFLNKKRTTDVLAFKLSDNDNRDFLGEVYVNLQQARRQARENNVNYNEEVERLTVHGVLHLLGYSDGDGENRRKMWSLQESYLNRWKR
jgi:probable rRNA maturation factor